MTDQWRIKRANKEYGPISSEQLRNLANTGKLRPTDLIRSDKSDWRHADSISGLFPQAGNNKTPPKLPSARLIIVRKPKLTGFLSSVSVKIDGEERGSLGGGFPSGIIDLLTASNKSTNIELDSGNHQIEVSGGGLKTERTINLKPGQNFTLITLFSNMGAMGGGLRLDEDQTGSPVSTQTNPDLNAERKRWTLKGIVGLGVVCFGFLILCAGIFGGIVGSSPESNTIESQTSTTEKGDSEEFAPPLDTVTISRLRKGLTKFNVRRIVGGKPQHEQINRLEGYPDKTVFPFQHVQEYLVEGDADARIILLYEVGSSSNPYLESILRVKK